MSTSSDRTGAPGDYNHQETRDLVALVEAAAARVAADGEAAFAALAVPSSRWRQDETYVFVLDPEGHMHVHPDSALAGHNTLALKDVQGKPIVGGLIRAATAFPDRPAGWYHYQWPVPGGLLPRWKSSYVRQVQAPSGRTYIVGAGMYDDRMERAFVVDMVSDAVAALERGGESALAQLREPAGPFMAKDAYVFVLDLQGQALVHPGFPTLEGRDLSSVQDTQGEYIVREMLARVAEEGAGWVDYLWPKPGESASTQKSTYVAKAKLNGQWVLVGCGVYLADAPKQAAPAPKISAAEVIALVREAAAKLEAEGEAAYEELRRPGSKWFYDDVYVVVVTLDGIRVVLPPDPTGEGVDVRDLTDGLGRPYGRMILDVARSEAGQGWTHYMFPLPGGLFPTWKSTFVQRVTFPSGQPHAIGCGIYNMQMDRAFVEDVVQRAASLIEAQGRAAFDALRDPTGPFVFMDTYVFVQSPDGTELVNAGLPSLEGRNLLALRDAHGRPVIREQIDAVMRAGAAWREMYWYKPGDNTPARKLTYVRKVQAGPETFIVGSGIYSD
ncbi:cache domain-containing protein [Ectothiorhodospiraceae bacterium 2226]|nr:cache domain-containing protein [Ectothiorhodospiraceae bacterium 2226]